MLFCFVCIWEGSLSIKQHVIYVTSVLRHVTLRSPEIHTFDQCNKNLSNLLTRSLMKKAGFIILAIGIVITIFTEFSFITKRKISEFGNIVITSNRDHNLAWSPMVGITMVIMGCCVCLLGLRKERSEA
jgi:hypothetical protein